MNLFLDTNALVKLYHIETGSQQLLNFIEKNSQWLIITITDLSEIEFHSSFLKRVRMGEISKIEVINIFKYLYDDLRQFNIIEINNDIMKFAIELLDFKATNHSLRTLDAIQLSSAILSNSIVTIDYFISSDLKLNKIAQEYFKIFNPAIEM
jgi:predicted nucleic acid-binding protein